ncbi:hypothetical protein DFS34DRAFT_646956 [Phlyctochytrium arcticum]|nr:hypothetical protein DFS34DRAFT_646956 [Phlyctochytrium arcticum]
MSEQRGSQQRLKSHRHSTHSKVMTRTLLMPLTWEPPSTSPILSPTSQSRKITSPSPRSSLSSIWLTIAILLISSQPSLIATAPVATSNFAALCQAFEDTCSKAADANSICATTPLIRPQFTCEHPDSGSQTQVISTSIDEPVPASLFAESGANCMQCSCAGGTLALIPSMTCTAFRSLLIHDGTIRNSVKQQQSDSKTKPDDDKDKSTDKNAGTGKDKKNKKPQTPKLPTAPPTHSPTTPHPPAANAPTEDASTDPTHDPNTPYGNQNGPKRPKPETVDDEEIQEERNSRMALLGGGIGGSVAGVLIVAMVTTFVVSRRRRMSGRESFGVDGDMGLSKRSSRASVGGAITAVAVSTGLANKRASMGSVGGAGQGVGAYARFEDHEDLSVQVLNGSAAQASTLFPNTQSSTKDNSMFSMSILPSTPSRSSAAPSPASSLPPLLTMLRSQTKMPAKPNLHAPFPSPPRISPDQTTPTWRLSPTFPTSPDHRGAASLPPNHTFSRRPLSVPPALSYIDASHVHSPFAREPFSRSRDEDSHPYAMHTSGLKSTQSLPDFMDEEDELITADEVDRSQHELELQREREEMRRHWQETLSGKSSSSKSSSSKKAVSGSSSSPTTLSSTPVPSDSIILQPRHNHQRRRSPFPSHHRSSPSRRHGGAGLRPLAARRHHMGPIGPSPLRMSILSVSSRESVGSVATSGSNGSLVGDLWADSEGESDGDCPEESKDDTLNRRSSWLQHEVSSSSSPPPPSSIPPPPPSTLPQQQQQRPSRPRTKSSQSQFSIRTSSTSHSNRTSSSSSTSTNSSRWHHFTALSSFTPRADDEISVGEGDRVVVWRVWEDGWCAGGVLGSSTQRTSRRRRSTLIREGVFPLRCLRIPEDQVDTQTLDSMTTTTSCSSHSLSDDDENGGRRRDSLSN